jgi:hypothetical protein
MRWFIAVVVLAAPLAAFADSSHCYNIKAQDLKNQCVAGAGK